VFNPQTDPAIYKNYNVETFELKVENKYALQKEMGLPKKDVPVIGLISRLTGQKGLNLIMDEIDEMMKEDIQFVLLEPEMNIMRQDLRKFRKSILTKWECISGLMRLWPSEFMRQ